MPTDISEILAFGSTFNPYNFEISATFFAASRILMVPLFFGSIPQDVLDKIEAYSKDIVDGKIDVPEDPK